MKLKIVSTGGPNGTRIFLDDKELQRVLNVQISMKAQAMNEATITFLPTQVEVDVQKATKLHDGPVIHKWSSGQSCFECGIDPNLVQNGWHEWSGVTCPVCLEKREAAELSAVCHARAVDETTWCGMPITDQTKSSPGWPAVDCPDCIAVRDGEPADSGYAALMEIMKQLQLDKRGV